MALWQYTFYILPGGFDERMRFENSGEGFDDSQYWLPKKIKSSFFESIRIFLPERRSWSKNIVLYGNQDSNCVEVLLKEGVVESVSFRLDFISDYFNIVQKIIDFCIMNNLVLLDEDLKIVQLDMNEIQELINNSPQFKQYKDLTK